MNISLILVRSEVNMNFYGRQVTPYQLLSGEVPPPEAANCLYQALSNAIEACDRYYGISQTERQHQDMLKLLDPQNSSKYLPKKENSTNLEDCSTTSRGIGDQYI